MNPNVQTKVKFLGYRIHGVSFNVNENYSKKSEEEIKLDISVNSFLNEETKKGFFLNLQIKLHTSDNSFELVLNSRSAFETDEQIETSYLESPMVKVNAPAIVFPFLRAFITTVTTNAGYEPIILPPINFAKFSGREKEA